MAPPEHTSVTIPREIFWICTVAPLGMAPVLAPRIFALPVSEALMKLAAMYLPFFAIPLCLRVVYEHVMPGLLARTAGRVHRFVVHALVDTLVALLTATLVRPVGALLEAPGPLWLWYVQCVLITWIFMGPNVIIQEQRARAERIERQARAEREAALEAQLSALAARTNPHFFFNSVNTVASLIPEDPVLAEQTLVRLADILRYALEGSRTRFVPLSRELSVVRDYLAVQEARFGKKLRVHIDVDASVADVPVPPLFLQPLVENAVLHGVGQRSSGGAVSVTVARTDQRARIEVLDDGVGPGRSQHRGSGTALADLDKRLRLLYGAEGRLESGPRAEGGFRVCVTVPARAEDA